MVVGYVRVSTKEQNIARQAELMAQLGAEKVFTDHMSGKNTERPELRKMMDFVREGDTVIVESISRFARNARDLLDLMEQLKRWTLCHKRKLLTPVHRQASLCLPFWVRLPNWKEKTFWNGKQKE